MSRTLTVSNNKTKRFPENITNIYRKVAAILHLRKTTVIRCVKSETFGKHSKSSICKPTKIDDFSQEVIRRKIYQLYEKKKLPTIPLIQDAIKDEISVSNTARRAVLGRMGFCWRRTTDDRRVVIEKTDSKAARAKYIRTIKQHRRDGKHIV